MAEKAVQTAKRLLKKAKKDRRDPYLALLDFRNTPRDKHLETSVQRLMGRRTKTTLPTRETLLKSKLVKNVSSNLKEKRNAEKRFYDTNSRKLPQSRGGDDVRIRRGNIWEPGHVVKRSNAPRSFVVKSRNQLYRRNRRDLLKKQKKSFLNIRICHQRVLKLNHLLLRTIHQLLKKLLQKLNLYQNNQNDFIRLRGP